MYSVIGVTLTAVGFFCGSNACSALLITPLLPWILFVNNEFLLSLPLAVFPLLFLVNAGIMYLLGAFVQYIVSPR